MSSDFNNWNTPYKKPRMNSRPPPGLKGKEIGLFYKNRQMKKNAEGKSKKEFSVTFTMPPSITLTIRKNVQTILKTAQKENIMVPLLKRNYMNNEWYYIKKEPQKHHNEKISKMFDKIKGQYAEDECASVKSEPKDEVPHSIATSMKSEPVDECVSIKSDPKDDVPHNIPTSVKSEPIDECENDIKETFVKPKVGRTDQKNESGKSTPEESHEIDCKPSITQVEKRKAIIDNTANNSKACTSTDPDLNYTESGNQAESLQRQLELRPVATFKYGYEDIITGSFEEKLEEQLAKGVEITKDNSENAELSIALLEEYKNMVQQSQYKKMLEFRKILPTYKKSKDILDAISENQVVVISGETGCGKSTQVPQIILDDAICNKRGAMVKILVTEPRRIAASSLATRVAKERAEQLGNSVGYAVRLERVNERARGSIQFCTTGILLADLETNQSLSNLSHIILDEVHERDSHIDLAMCMLKQVLKMRTDLKLILMSATIDSESLSEYFGNCLKINIEGLAYPVKDVYLEDVLAMTNFRLSSMDTHTKHNLILRHKKYNRNKRVDTLNAREEKKIQEHLNEVGDWIYSKRHELDVNVQKTLKNPKIESLNYDLIVELIRHICRGDPGAILVFVPGSNDISKILNLLKETHIRPPRFEIYSLHSKLPSLEQNKIFEKPANNIRKIIIATNIAETSITIDDIVYVIDCGRHKIKGLNVDQNVETLDVQHISKANLRQRRGRAGRCQPGFCYHLITSFRADKLEDRTLPELQRSNLLEAVLMIKRLRLGLAKDALKKVPSPPAESSIEWAVKQLQRCGALDAAETLTPLGWHMARLPVHPAAGKLLLLGALFGCLDRAASIAAVWGFKDPYILIAGKEREIDACRRNLTMGEPSDHVGLSEAIISFEHCPRRDRRDFCFANFLSYNTCELLSGMKNQLGGNLKAMGFLPSGNVKAPWENRNANNLSLFKAIVAAALYPNIATARWVGLNSRKQNPIVRVVAHTPEDGKVAIHPSSAMSNGLGAKKGPIRGLNCNKPGANWLVYWMKRRSVNLYVYEVTLIYSLPLLFFGDFILSQDPESPDNCILEVSSIKVRLTKETADLLYDLRVLLDHVLASKVMSSSESTIRSSKFEEQVLNTVIELITAEDEQSVYVEEEVSDSDYSENDNDSSFCA